MAIARKPTPLGETVGAIRVRKYRENLDALKIQQVNLMVPERHVAELHLVSDRFRAEYFLEICERSVDDEARIVLANRNTVSIPTQVDISTLGEQLPAKSPLRGELRRMRSHTRQAAQAMAAVTALNRIGGEDSEFIKWASLAVAHAHMAKYLNEFVQWHIKTATEGEKK